MKKKSSRRLYLVKVNEELLKRLDGYGSNMNHLRHITFICNIDMLRLPKKIICRVFEHGAFTISHKVSKPNDYRQCVTVSKIHFVKNELKDSTYTFEVESLDLLKRIPYEDTQA